jgi:sec-independent protein translocase protein TatA
MFGGGWSISHLLIVAVVVMVLFGGRGKLSGIMGDFAQGIKAFKKGLADDDATDATKTTTEVKSVADQAKSTIDKTTIERKV